MILRFLIRICGWIILLPIVFVLILLVVGIVAILFVVEVFLSILLGKTVNEAIDETLESVQEKTRRQKNGPPPVCPLKEAQLSMPVVLPEPKKTFDWPPFTGERVELGKGAV